MSLVLIHLDPDGGPIGAWRRCGGQWNCFYSQPDPEREMRARNVINAKGDDVPWDEWLSRLARRTPYRDAYELFTAPEDMSLPIALTTFTAHWRNHF